MTFDACYAETLRHEGGYSDHPSDPGGATQHGVTQATYDAYRRRRGRPTRAVREIAGDETREIYRDQYWAAVRGDELPAGVDLVVYDFAVNSGPVRAIRALQAALGVEADGHLGEQTLAALRNRLPAGVIGDVCERRLAFMRQARDKRGAAAWPTFGKGWSRRVCAVYLTAMRMVQKPVDAAMMARCFSADALGYGRRWVARFHGAAKSPPILDAVPPAGDMIDAGEAKALPASPAAQATLDKALAAGGAASTIVATLAGAVSNPYALAALALVAVVAGVLAWRLWPRATLPEALP